MGVTSGGMSSGGERPPSFSRGDSETPSSPVLVHLSLQESVLSLGFRTSVQPWQQGSPNSPASRSGR